MNFSFRQISLVAAITTLSLASYGQATNETSAALERQKAQKAVMMGKADDAITALKSAKEFIDKAAVHEDTKNNAKTLWLVGDIYGSLYTMAKASGDADLMAEVGEDGLEKSANSLQMAFEKTKTGTKKDKKSKSDIIATVDQFRNGFFMAAGLYYDQEQFEDAGFYYEWQGRFAETIDMLDTTACFNAGLCYEKSEKYAKAAENYKKLSDVDYIMNGTHSAVFTSRAFRKAGDLVKAKEVVMQAREKHPSDKDLLTELVNTNIESGDAAGAEKALNDAIAADPNNVQLHYTIGTIYIDLKENQKAEDALRKALELDPDNADIQYQLGAHLYNWATELKLERDKLSKGDPRDAELLEQSEAKMNGAIEVLEKYIEKDPENKAILDILYRAYYKSGNSAKALEYKKRLDALK